MRKRLLVKGPAKSSSGYGTHARFVLKALKTREDLFDIMYQDISWGKTGRMPEKNDPEFYEWLNFLEQKTQHYVQNGGQFDVSVQVTIPNEIQKLAVHNINVQAGIECNRISPVWIEKSEQVDRIIVPSQHSKFVYDNTSYQVQHNVTKEVNNNYKNKTPVDVVGYPVRLFEPKEVPGLDLTTDFNFLAVAQMGPRKNIDLVIRWFIEEFIDNENVGLVLKVNFANNSMIDFYQCKEAVSNLSKEYPNKKCKVYLVHGDMTDEEMSGLYNHPKIKAIVGLGSEGYGLPLFEAAYYGLPVVTFGWSGQCDFLYKPVQKDNKIKMRPFFAKVDFNIMPVPQHAVWPGVIEPDAMWAYPQQGSFKMKLREVYKDHGRFKAMARELKEHVYKEFAVDKQYALMIDSILKGCGASVKNEQDNIESGIKEF